MLADAKARGYDQPQTLALYDRFKDYHLAKGSLMVSWDAAFRTWMGNDKKWSAERKPANQPSQHRLTYQEEARERQRQAFDNVRARLNGTPPLSEDVIDVPYHAYD